MSNLVLPNLVGFGLAISRTPVDGSVAQETLSGAEFRSTWSSFPRYQYRLALNFARTRLGEFQQIVGHFVRVAGQVDSFLWQDPEDNAVAAHPFGKGDGTTTVFQLQRTMFPVAGLVAPYRFWPTYGDGFEPVQDLAGAPTLYVNGTSTSAYTLGNDGVVTFTTAPASGANLTWDGAFWKRVRFSSPLAMTRIVSGIWSASSIDLVTVKGGGGVTYTTPPAGFTFAPPGSISQPGAAQTSLQLQDSNGTTWTVTVDTNGAINTTS